MTQIFFYSGCQNKLSAACRLGVKAIQQGKRVLVYAPDAAIMDRFDQLLWTFSATSFIPHCRIEDEESLVQVTPIILTREIPRNTSFDVLLNLHQHPPSSFNEFDRLIEIAETTTEDKLAARERYRFYKEKGYDIQHHQLDI